MSTPPKPMGGERDIELGLPVPTTNTAPVYTFQHILEDIRQFSTLLGSTPEMLHKLEEANKELKSAAESAAVKEIRGRIEKDMDEAVKTAQIMKENLSRIFQGVLVPVLNNMSTGHAYPGFTVPFTLHPSTLPMITALKIKLKERKKDLENLGKAIQEEAMEVVQSRIFTVTGVKLSHEVIRVIDSNSIMQMFENRVHGIGPEQAGAIGEEIKERRGVAMDLGKKVVEMQKNFREMLAIARAQEKMVMALSQVQSAAARARSIAEELARAESTADELREDLEKTKLLMALFAIVLVLCIVGVILSISG